MLEVFTEVIFCLVPNEFEVYLCYFISSQQFNEVGDYLHDPDEKTRVNPSMALSVIPVIIVSTCQRQKEHCELCAIICILWGGNQRN